MSTLSPRHLAALAYAEENIPIFPCQVGGKKPACVGGFKSATTDRDRINAWWAEADYNVAFCPEDAGWCVVDIERNGEAAWAKYEAEHGPFPETYEVQTPRGGRHLYYRGSLPSTVRKLVDKEAIDTRGRLGYVLIPPSIVDGRTYEVIRDVDIVPAPACIAAHLEISAPMVETVGAQPDLAGNTARARALLISAVHQGDVAIEGQGGNNRTYQLACEVLGLGLSPQMATTCLLETWNDHCRPPWDPDELGIIVENAARYMQNEIGAWAVPDPEDVFGETVKNLPPESSIEKVKRSLYYMEDEREQEQTPDTQWTILNMIPDRATVLLLGHTGHLKSFLAQHILMSLAAGHSGVPFAAIRPGPTFYATNEGIREVKKERRKAWKMFHNIKGEIPFYVGRAPLIIDEAGCLEFKEEIRKRLRQNKTKIAAIVLDTVAKCMAGLDENKASDVGKFVAFCDSLRDEFECPVIALHHTGKDAERGARGSSALQAGFDTTLLCRRLPDDRGKAVQLRVLQHKNGEEPEEDWTFEARRFGPSLVLQPTTKAEHAALVHKDDPYDKRKVGAALREMGTFGAERSVSTEALANTLRPGDEKAAVTLRKLAKDTLQAYCEVSGRDLAWFLPLE